MRGVWVVGTFPVAIFGWNAGGILGLALACSHATTYLIGLASVVAGQWLMSLPLIGMSPLLGLASLLGSSVLGAAFGLPACVVLRWTVLRRAAPLAAV